VKVDSKNYREDLLKKHMLPVMRRIAGNTFVFQQYHVPAHQTCETVQLLQQETLDFISLDLWPPNSPDINPVDYRIWGLTQECVYKTPLHDTSDWKHRFIDTMSWASIPQNVIDEAVGQFYICMREGERISL